MPLPSLTQSHKLPAAALLARILLLVLVLALLLPPNPQAARAANLSPGDIAFVQYNAAGTDDFKFVSLADIPAGTVIYFTDNGWDNTSWRTGEGIITWTAPAGGLTCGTLVTVSTTPSTSHGTVSESGDVNFSTSGDQLIAYQDSAFMLAALNNNGSAVWQSAATDTNTSALPSGLSNGSTAVALQEVDNAKYNGTLLSGTRADLLAAIHNPSNWSGDNTTNQVFDGTITVTDCGGTPPPANLLISEIMYDPASAEDDWEWVEVYNPGSSAVDLSGYVLDDHNSSAHTSANITSGSVPAGGSAILYNASDVSAADFAAAWGSGLNLVAVSGWANLSLNNSGDQLSLWDSFAAYSGDHQAHANALDTVAYSSASPWPVPDGAASIYLLNLGADNSQPASWALSSPCTSTPLYSTYRSQASGGSSGGDLGSPGSRPADFVLINELDADSPDIDAAEFIELYDGGLGYTPLDGLVLVTYNGNGDLSYALSGHSQAIDLDGYCTDAQGFFVLGNSAVSNVQLVFGNNSLQNGPDAVALYLGEGSDFPAGSALATSGLLDALVYDTADADDSGLLPLLLAGEPQVNEAGGGDSAAHSNQRCPDYSGGARVTSTYRQFPPSPGSANNCTTTDLELSLSADNNNPNENDPLTYTLTVSNNPASTDAASNLELQFYLPSTSTAVQYLSNDCAASLAGDTLTWPAGTLAAGASLSCAVQVSVRPGTDGSSLLAQAQVSAVDQNDPDSTPGNLGAAPAEDDEARLLLQVGTHPACGTSGSTRIHAIQGSGLASPLLGTIVTVEALVVADFQAAGQLGGFFLQEPDSQADGDPATSEGLFIYDNLFGVDVSPGQRVRLTGTVAEFFDQTQLQDISAVYLCGSASLPAAASLSLPLSAAADLEPYEGMLVSFPQSLYVSEHYELGRYGQLYLSSGDRLWQPTHVAAPGAPALAVAQQNLLNRLLLDDGSNVQNPDPIVFPAPGLSASNTLRGGDRASGLNGVLGFAYSEYRLYPTSTPAFQSDNPRPSTPPATHGSLRIASFNVLNYFVTLDDGSLVCGPSGGMGCRGADSAFEFTRQKDKIVNALLAIDADIFGLIEIENHPSDAALLDLVAALNASAGAGTYAAVNTGTIGTDAIKVALIYKPAHVSPVGAHKILDSSIDPTFLDTKNRPSLAQTFEQAVTAERFTVVVNHLKSKGSSCSDVGDDDAGDGQGNCNGTRTDAAQAIVTWLAGDPTGSADPDFLLLGDMNAYAQEDPITAFKGGGYSDLSASFHPGSPGYSYVFDGQWGYLDYGLASPSLLSQVTAAEHWTINSDEPIVLDYNQEYKTSSQLSSLYSSAPYRASDHDPVLLGLFGFDFSDLDSSYGIAWHNGAGSLRLGSSWQAGMDYASGADNADDDGVSLVTATWQPGGSLTFDLTSSGAGYLAGWFDWDRNGLFEAGEKALSYTFTTAGTVRQTVTIGASFDAASADPLPVRFRLYSSEPLLGPTGTETPSGVGSGGEVEDYHFSQGPTAVQLLAFQAHSSDWPWLASFGCMVIGWMVAGGFKRSGRAGLGQTSEVCETSEV